MSNIIVRMASLPLHLSGVTVEDANGDYNIYINELLSDYQQIQALKHEREHIVQGHFHDDNSVWQNEIEAG